MADTVWKTATPGPRAMSAPGSYAMSAPAGSPLFPSFNRKARRHD
jgi:hypothetical protein